MPVNMTGFAGRASRRKRANTVMTPAIPRVLEPSLKEKDDRLGQLRLPLTGTTKHSRFGGESTDKEAFCCQLSQPANDQLVNERSCSK